jgi:tetratricopeptide (TPR) repeat protein
MISKIDSGYFGYEAVTGRYACYMLGYIYQFKKDYEKAKLYFKRTVDYGEQANALKMGYYLHACSYLGKIMSKEGKTGEACLYFEKVKKNADKKDDERILNEAKEFLSKNDCKK